MLPLLKRTIPLAVALALVCGGARAQPSGDVTEAREAARALAERGFDLLEAGKYSQAIEHFERAEARFHAPTHLLYLARAYAKLGKLVEARTRYQSVASERLANYAPDAFRDAQAAARSELALLEERMPKIAVTLTGSLAAKAQVTIDGKAVSSDALSRPVLVDPGLHVVEASASGAPKVGRSVNLREGKTETVQLVVQAQGTAAADPPIPPPTPPTKPDKPETPPPGDSHGSIIPAVVAFGVGGIGAVVGSVTGILSLNRVADLDAKCPSKQGCTDADGDLATDARELGSISTVSFIVAGAGVATGVVLLLVRPGGSTAPTVPPSVSLDLGVGSLRVKGSF